MKVLGVDPGSRATGWGLVISERGQPRLLDCGVIALPARLDFGGRLARLHDELARVVSRLAPDRAAVETPFHGNSARAALQLAHARGVILAVLAGAEVPVAEYTPATVKKRVTGNGRANKEQVGRIVAQTLGCEIQRGDHDLSDALAVGLCHLGSLRYQTFVRRAMGRDRTAAPRRRV